MKGPEGKLLAPERLAIRALTFKDLRQQLQDGRLKAVQVLDAYRACVSKILLIIDN